MKLPENPGPRGDLTKIRITSGAVNEELVYRWPCLSPHAAAKLLRGDRNVIFAAVKSHAIAVLRHHERAWPLQFSVFRG